MQDITDEHGVSPARPVVYRTIHGSLSALPGPCAGTTVEHFFCRAAVPLPSRNYTNQS